MKAALNGVPSLSILDGWWIEGCAENTTGWAIEDGDTEDRRGRQPLQQARKERRPALRQSRSPGRACSSTASASTARFFNTHRMSGPVLRQRLLPLRSTQPRVAIIARLRSSLRHRRLQRFAEANPTGDQTPANSPDFSYRGFAFGVSFADGADASVSGNSLRHQSLHASSSEPS